MHTESLAVQKKSRLFAVRIVRLCQYLTTEQKEFTLSKQILRSGTSIGANIAESSCAFSRKDFLSKMYVAFKECNETLYWLDLLHDTDYLTDRAYLSLYSDCKELHRLLSAITKTTREYLNES